MNLTVTEPAGIRLVEGPLGGPLFHSIDDVVLLIEACFSNKARCALLYATNLTAQFFDLSSGEAGAILQKLRQYRIRLAVVCPPGTVRFSARFGDMAEEEARGKHFRIFESPEAAREWLAVPQ
jgi:hypothetical protein